MSVLGERIKQLREEANLTQEQLAAKLGLTKGAVGNYETGARRPDGEIQEAIADLFNVELDYLNGRTNNRPEFSLEEQWLIGCYRAADDDIKDVVKTLLRKFDK